MGLKPVSVSQLNSYIKRILQTDPILRGIYVKGEVSNLKFHSSGHVYFSLKDEKSRINCFLASPLADSISDRLEEGSEVAVSGYIYLYERGGSYSINVRDIEQTGKGDLAAEFERLKLKLEKQGVFDKSRKKPIPRFPEKIAVVTSATGAAVRDITKIITRKNDFVDILICPVLVQGPAAAAEISSMIDHINENFDDVDTIIAGRGGGSAEELWAFNEEIVAMSIYNSRIPVISAVGHETDFTIADFAADMRAETPSAAAEAAVFDTNEIREYMSDICEHMKEDLRKVIDDRRRRLDSADMNYIGRDILSRIAMENMRIEKTAEEMKDTITDKIKDLRNDLEIIKESLESSNPRSILKRGYSVITDEKGRIISDMTKLKKNQRVNIEGADSFAKAEIIESRKR